MNSRIKEDVSRLFEFWCEIAPGKPDDPAPGYIVESFPESFKDAKVIADIPAFAFPCAFESRTIQVHSFVLTNIDSKWRFGFCRHDPKSPTAMVIITYLPWHDTFMRFLNVLAEIKKNRSNEFQSFLAESYNKGVPEPGACLKLHYDRASQTFLFQRPQQFQLPSIPENHNLNQYYNFVEPKFMIGIFAAMLAERRIIFVSRRLEILSSCVQAANAFLYPMVWQHIFIPVLPMQMKDILAAPMPFLIGVPEAVYETLRREEIGEVVILNCDKRTLETPFDDVKSMPQELVGSLKKQLSNQADHRGDRVSKIFLGILVQLIGGYRDAVKFNDKITFDPETFIESRPSHLRPFLEKILDLQIFQQFIEERLDMLNTGQGFSDEFEVEYFRYAEKSGRKTKQYKDLLKNFKDKTNPAVRSAVKSVKEGGKGVKTAYKGLRSKFRETTPPKTKLDSSSSLHLHHQYDVSGGHHQSAPNSPVFNKRPQTIALPDDVYHTHHHHPHQMLTPSSTSLHNSPHILLGGSHHHQHHASLPQTNGGGGGSAGNSSSAGYHTASAAMTHSASSAAGSTSHMMMMNNNLNYGHGNAHGGSNNNNYNSAATMASSSASDIRSPTLSPTSSNSSSEMNLWQEMQHHLTLFKSPAVNRNLKPSNSVDGGGSNSGGSRPSSRAGAPVSPPGSNGGTALPRIQESVGPPAPSSASHPLLSLELDRGGGSSSSSRAATAGVRAYGSCNNNGELNGLSGDGDQANFDLSPDAPCPPIPPRRFQSAADALAAIQISPPPMSPPSSSSSSSSPYRTYNNFVPLQPKPKSATFASPSSIDQSPPLPSPPPPPPLKATSALGTAGRRKEEDVLLPLNDEDDDQLLTLTTTTTTTTAPAVAASAAKASTNGGAHVVTTTTTTSVSMTFDHGTKQSNHHHHNQQPHIMPPSVGPAASAATTSAPAPPQPQHAYTLPHPPKAQAPQPPQRPPLAPKPTFRKESANGDTPDHGSTPPPTATDDSLDLITLDTTNNSSFELEDFDPLNERAKPIGGPKGGGAGVTVHDTSSSALTTSSYSSSGLAATASRGVTVPTVSFPTNSLGVNNPVYPYFTPLYQQNVSPHRHHSASHQHHHPSARQGTGIGTAAGAGTGAGPRASNTSDDFELLRNYGLDKFSLLDGGSTARANALHMNGGSTGSKGIQHHHTGSFNLPNHQQGSAGLNGTGGSCSSSRLAMSTSAVAGSSIGTELLENAAIGRPSSGSRPSFSNWTTFD
ncbi:mucin-19 [Anopheles ziemanni]|uniref:mucin-19 n=1 Tax=Anopheles ziemanni TaxID=345580 RepID=UPI0026588061|nr:mucin-19 isoform X1 [Anopheles coustani]XP_058126405.1 mucin-19 isoform X1 [Anopheles coustani]XP_058168230.1 mucin-19 [Anopheles ziemanni]